MLKPICFVLLACVAGSVAAQLSKRSDPADPKAGVPALAHESAFKTYRPYTDPEIARWRDVNEEVSRSNGRVEHVPGSAPARGASAPSKPPAAAGHGGHK